MSSFKDNFSGHSTLYARYRPGYPPELFAWLRSLTEKAELAWDCGTGNGQAAVSLAEYFTSVFASDPSEPQIANAIPHERVTYRVEKAEQCSLGDHSADLVTVAQALHWFDFDAFYHEVKRVLRHGGVLAAWAYGIPQCEGPVNDLIRHLHDDVLGDLWQPENRMIEAEYRTIPFPFEEIPAPELRIVKPFLPGELAGHLSSWSAVQRYIDKFGTDPVAPVAGKIAEQWGDPLLPRDITWKLIIKAGRNVS